MRILNFGSLNIDNVYHVKTIVKPGETIASSGMEVNCGGKGLNQSVALAKAGMEVFHAGMVGKDGQILLDVLAQAGVNTSLIQSVDCKSGHTVIQVDDMGQNSIVLCGGANHEITKAYVDAVLGHFQEGEPILLQNEISMQEYVLKRAAEKKMRIILNPSPMDEKLASMDLTGVSLMLLNEIEGEQMTGRQQPEEILDELGKKYPKTEVVLTLGREGSVFRAGTRQYRQDALCVEAVDTTAAGDTFTGFFVREYFETGDPKEALSMAAKASAMAVMREGAAKSIPLREQVINWM